MNPKLKYRLIKLEKALVFQILEQDARFLNRNNFAVQPFHASNGMTIYSKYDPELNQSSTNIYLRGVKESSDLHPSLRTYPTNEARDIAFNKIQAALVEWAKLCPVFASNSTSIKMECPDIFIL
jgi:hypothetical protein